MASEATAYTCIERLFVPPNFYRLLAIEERRQPCDQRAVECLRRRIELVEAMVLYRAAQRANANT